MVAIEFVTHSANLITPSHHSDPSGNPSQGTDGMILAAEAKRLH